jgi:hypothetical protein
MATVTFERGGRSDSQRQQDMWRVGASTMCIAIEFLNGPSVLMLRVYAEWKVTERRTAVKNVRVHGCYRAGMPILIDSTQVDPDLLPDVGALRAALASSLRDSRVAVLVTAVTPPPAEPAALGEAVFTSLKEALAWLTEPAQ